MIDVRDLELELKNYWTEVFPDYPFVLSLMRAESELNENTRLLYEATVKATNPNSLAWNRTVPWIPVFMKESKHKFVDAVLYDDLGVKYDDGHTYDQKRVSIHWEVPDSLVSIQVIVSSPFMPKRSLVLGKDFSVVKNANGKKILIFNNTNLFEELGQVIDGETYLIFWAKNTTWINEHYFKQNELALNLQVTRDEYGAKLLKATWDAYCRGANLNSFYEGITGVTKAPVALRDGIVAYITDSTIVTENTVYKIPQGAAPVVAIGDKIRIGSQLVDSVRVLKGVNIKQAGSLQLTSIPGVNKVYNITVDDVPAAPLHYGEDADGYSIVGLPSTGASVQEFWTKTHKTARESGAKTLAQVLSGSNATTIPISMLPANIKALSFLSETVFTSDYLLEVDSALVNVDNINRYKYALDTLAGLGSQLLLKVN